uniref:Transcription elongation factor Spt6 YqgF domain-containing protein n=1 Tax=Panagrolaimus davidi TaxID=227884 RepID=A0A914Q8F4_9BILA
MKLQERQYQNAYGERIRIAGYAKIFAYEEDEFAVGATNGKDTRIMAIAYPGEFDLASYAVVVDHFGDIIESVRLANFLEREKLYDPGCPKVSTFVFFKYHIRRIVDNLLEQNEIPQSIPIDLYKNDIAKVYSQSELGKHELPDYVVLQRQAVSLARIAADPLVEISKII